MNRAQKILIFFLSVSSYSTIWTLRMHFIHVSDGGFDDVGQAADHLDLSPRRIIADQHQRENDAQFFVRNRRSLHDMKAWNTTGEAENSLHVRSFDETKSEASTRRFNGNVSNMTSRCALCFFGLPRSYKDMVLPSIQKNIILPNAKHGCDVFVHYYYKLEEDAGRFNEGGIIDPNEILLLENVVTNLTSKAAVQFVNDTDDQFFAKRNVELFRYENTTTKYGKPLYFPWKETGWTLSAHVNVVRQWHSVERAFRLMEDYAQQNQINYSRVAMLRNDVMFLTPIDIMQLENDSMDSDKNHFVIPAFAMYPVNDRMVYGPYEAVKVWATKRFELIEERASNPKSAGKVLHSERFMKYNIIPAMESLGYTMYLNRDICFSRTRANSVVFFNDCFRKQTRRLKGLTEVRGINTEKQLKKTVEGIIGKICPRPLAVNGSVHNAKYLKC